MGETSKKANLQGTPSQSLTIERGAMRSALDRPEMMIGGQQATLNKHLNGAKSSKAFERMGEGINGGPSIQEP